MSAIQWLRHRLFDLRPSPSFPEGTDEPILAELFSMERLEQHVTSLAAAQSVTTEPRRGVASISLDGRTLTGEEMAILLADDGASHRVEVILGQRL